ncbi:unnamed protein product [Paramecium pentaurelia]|uniref:Uncharacterized protein n=1 Tax=Paramecium pentaurelia TaxID=43138 RepID=A0A8S1SS91_9CILI|nr:unnamed protein product [Paramecium pentaurelia]
MLQVVGYGYKISFRKMKNFLIILLKQQHIQDKSKSSQNSQHYFNWFIQFLLFHQQQKQQTIILIFLLSHKRDVR